MYHDHTITWKPGPDSRAGSHQTPSPPSPSISSSAACCQAALSPSPNTRGYFLCSQRHVAIKRQQPGVREGAAGACGTISLETCQKRPVTSPYFSRDGASLGL